MAAYADACDAQDLDQLEAIFAPDVVVSVPGMSWGGLDAVRGILP